MNYNEENEIKQEYAVDPRKAMMFADSVIGRKRLRMMRYTLHLLNMTMSVPGGYAQYTHDYCRKYADHESGNWKYDVLQRKMQNLVRDWGK